MQFTVDGSVVISFEKDGVVHHKTTPCIMCGACCCEVPANWAMGVKPVPPEWTFLQGLGYNYCCKHLKYHNSSEDKFYTQKFNCQAPLGIPRSCLAPSARTDNKYEPADICTVEYGT